jgi:hypothetical protein
MKAVRTMGAANLLAIITMALMFYAAVNLSGCATPKVEAAPTTASHAEPDDHVYCLCIATCEGGPATPIDMPEASCQNPPPQCSALPLYCSIEDLEDLSSKSTQQQNLNAPPPSTNPPGGPKVYEI